MLVLSRKPTQSVAVGDNLLTVTVLAVRGRKVTLAFQAAPELPILRTEVQTKRNGRTEPRKPQP